MGKFFIDLFSLFVMAGHLLLLAVWSGLGLALAMTPAFLAAKWLASGADRAPIFWVVLFVTGLLSVKLNRLSLIVEVFHLGNRIILRGMENMVAEVAETKRRLFDKISLPADPE